MITYLDNAATTFPKPPAVNDEVLRCLRSYCGNPGRSAHPLAAASADKIYECRERLAAFFGSEHPENIIFTMNTTYALNMAIKGLIRKGDHILISDMEHNSVYRPVSRLASEGIAAYDIFPTVKDGLPLDDEEILSSIKKRIRRGRTRMLICSHVPNICSAERPIKKIGELCRRCGIIFVVDAAQSAGHLPIDIGDLCIDVLCAPAHKGLFGIQGCGFMLLGKGTAPLPIIEGGSGVNSLEAEMPDMFPERYEAGTLPTPCIAGLSEGIGFLSKIPSGDIAKKEAALFKRTRELLEDSRLLNAKIYFPDSAGSVLLFNLDGIPSEDVGRFLGKQGICVRSGFHCSALGHRALGTEDDGAVRVSFSIMNTERDVDILIKALRSLRQ